MLLVVVGLALRHLKQKKAPESTDVVGVGFESHHRQPPNPCSREWKYVTHLRHAPRELFRHFYLLHSIPVGML